MNKVNERYHNLNSLFRILRSEGSITQVDLKDRLSLQASTVSYLVNDFRALDLVQNSSNYDSPKRVGKPGQPIELANDQALFLGLYMEETFVDFHVIGIADEEIHSERVPIDCGPEELADLIIALIGERLLRYSSLKGVGIAVKSIVDLNQNLSSFKRLDGKVQPNQIWMVVGFAEKLRKAFPGLILVVENDANCAAVYCQSLTKYRYSTSMAFVINVNPFGIGCGIVIHGQLFRGANGASGEFYFPDRSIQEMVAGRRSGFSEEQLLPILKDSITKGIYLIDPEIVFLTGSVFSSLGEASMNRIRSELAGIPYKVEILFEPQYSLPARGAVLITSERYVSGLFSERNKRKP